MRPASALAAVGLIGCGFAAHFWGTLRRRKIG
jgi:hypothetical protein